MTRVLWFPVLIGLGCTEPQDNGTEPSSPSTTSEPEPFAGAPLAEITGGCPDVDASGATGFRSEGVRRDLLLMLPEGGGEGRPVLFFWHGLGGSAASYDVWLDFQAVADDNDMVVVVPDSLDPFGDTWTLGEGPDLDLFDHVRSCLARDLDVDLDRIYSTGFSFGGLFTTALTMDRGDSLAATLPMSGGTSPLWFPYRSPAHDVPVLVMWGGPTDTYGEGLTLVDFEEMSADLTTGLLADGHLVHACDHGLGHDVPAEWSQIVTAWFGAHTFGAPGPVSPGDYPDYCYAP